MDGRDQREQGAQFRLLGALEVTDGTRLLPLGGRTQRMLLAYLLLHANRAISVTQVVGALWDENPPASARNMLHNAAWRLRKLLNAIDGVELLSQQPGYLLRVPPELLDVYRFQRRLELGRTAASTDGPQAATAIFREALALWRGPVLDDLVHDRTWPMLAVLEESRLGAWEECFEAELALGRHREVIGELTELVEAEPLRERLCGQLMLALYRCGRQADALAVYRKIRTACMTELGIEPGPELRRLEQAILNQDVQLAGAARIRRPSTGEPDRPGEHWIRRQVSALLVRLGTGSELLGVVRAEADRFGGAVSSTMGDTVLAVFGAERTREDDPARAVRAALAIRERLPTDADVRMAIVTGATSVSTGGPAAPIVAGGLEPALAMLESVAPQEVRVCAATHAATSSVIEYRQVAGAWLAAGSRPGPACPDAGPLPLVGRDRELALLRRALDDTVRARRPQLVTLLGTAGIGKSRLIAELVHAAGTRPSPVRVLVGQSSPAEPGTPLAALATIVRTCLDIRATDQPAAAEHKLTGAVRELVANPERAQWIIGHVGALAGMSAQVRETGEARRAWAAFLEEQAADRPLVAVLEDVHLADDSLLDFLDELPARLGPVPLLLVVTARPELLDRRPNWGGGKPDATTLTLEPLSAPETAGLLHALFREHRLPDRIRPGEAAADGEFWHALVTAVGGNPAFAVEYVRMVRDRRDLWASAEPLPLPAMVWRTISARLDALPADEQAVLRDAAVLGTTLWPGLVAHLSGRPRAETERVLDRLVRREILRRNRRSSVAGESEYAFAHVLIREVAGERNPVLARVGKHRLAAAWLESRPIDHAAQLAYHYGEAVALMAAAGKPATELAAHARAVLTTTAWHATTLGARRIAARCSETALALCPPHDPARPELLLRYGKSLAAWHGGGVDVLTEAREALLLNGNPAGAANAEFALATLARRRSGRRTGYDRVLGLIGHAPPSDLAAETQSELAMALAVEGHVEAEELAERALTAAEELERPDIAAVALQARGTARVDRGDLGGVTDGERAVETCRRHGLSPARALGELRWISARAGDLSRLLREGEAAEIAERYGDVHLLRTLRGRAVVENYWTGQWIDARELATRMLRSVERDWLPLRSSWHVIRGRIALARGDHAAAMADAVRGLTVARLPAEPEELCPAQALAARIALIHGRTAEADRLAGELLAGLYGRTVPAAVGVDLPLVLAATGHGVTALDGVRRSPWLDAARAFLAGKPGLAAEIYQRIGSRPDALEAHLAAAEHGEAGAHLAAVTPFAAEHAPGWLARIQLVRAAA